MFRNCESGSAKPVKSKVKFWQMIGRGTRLCAGLYGYDDNGKPLDKQKFHIFDHWGNFDITRHTEEAEVTTTKSLAQKRFKAWIMLGAAAQRKFDKQAVDLVAHQLASRSTHWMKSRLPCRKSGSKKRSTAMKSAAPAFPKTQQDLHLSGLRCSGWIVRGQSDAMRFDMDILATNCPLYQPGRAGCSGRSSSRKWNARRRIWLRVQQQGQRINQLRDLGWWKQASWKDIRIHLRGIMHLMEEKRCDAKIWFDTGGYYRRYELIPGGNPPWHPLDWFQTVSSAGSGSAGAAVPAKKSVLKKIATGEPVTQSELDELAKLVLIRT